MISLSSSSGGNSTLIRAGDTGILIDAGLSARQLQSLLNEVQCDGSEIDAILVTHEHIDHVRGVVTLSNKFQIPVYATAGTFRGMSPKVGEVPFHQKITIDSGEDFVLGDALIEPLAVSHDANDPVAYRVNYHGRSVAVLTDLGYCPDSLLEKLEGVDMMVIESNYNPELLHENPRYPVSLKKRIEGRKGHLSNESCSNVLYELQRIGTRYALLGHLSKENNRPELAMREVGEGLLQKGVALGDRLHLELTHRDRPSARYAMDV